MKVRIKGSLKWSKENGELSIIEADEIEIIEEKPKERELKDWDFGLCEDGKIGIAIPADGGRNWISDHPFIPICNLADLIAEMQKVNNRETKTIRSMVAPDDSYSLSANINPAKDGILIHAIGDHFNVSFADFFKFCCQGLALRRET
jgi:hypothetical protein